jgi:NAD(P)-dependent dehydrogenase (short-subunit alcohol dehydrogenase family)
MIVAGVAAVVSGGASGLGEGSVRALVAAGARVAILDRDAANAERVAAATGALACACDVTDEASLASALDAAAVRNGAARIVVSCAGIGTAKRVLGRDGPMPLADFERVVRVNLIGTFNLVRLAAARISALEPLADGERGAIVLTASVAATDGQIGQAAYAASKGGIVALTLPLAREFAQFGVRVNTIAPGLFATPLMDELPGEVQANLAASIPFPKRLGAPDDFADLVLAVLRNAYLNGETIRLDGSLRLPPR